MVVSNMFYFHPYLGKWCNLTNMFQYFSHGLKLDKHDTANMKLIHLHFRLAWSLLLLLQNRLVKCRVIRGSLFVIPSKLLLHIIYTWLAKTLPFQMFCLVEVPSKYKITLSFHITKPNPSLYERKKRSTFRMETSTSFHILQHPCPSARLSTRSQSLYWDFLVFPPWRWL